MPFERFNDDIDDSTWKRRLKLGFNTAWSRSTYQKLLSLIRTTKPDLVHFHNTFPLISPSAYAACKESGVPVVQTLHNFRFICPEAMLMRDGRPCEECVGKYPWRALRHRCYRGSLLATGALTWMIARNHWLGVYEEQV
ncbi:MAG: glycosyltransferase, partial [Candidatus Latescibacteria bacterium]|nr:glycosyltransferase [Candidatus Latescibacterota bacterium]NIM22360.1 glycosyltransferase [Candidatus Latescibacterota bacterium]NIM65776.1 glycosyltransferase [Candidatus Latescibacterota bacterium]NIO02271.1 glycosyltransferase [Candidatus Latescibacterota bacterium]NIO29139.1 glycosyltransferase [Candidatus Latescibacterota bacterium]